MDETGRTEAGRSKTGRSKTGRNKTGRNKTGVVGNRTVKNQKKPTIQVGYHVGKLTVAAPTLQRKDSYVVWLCR